MLVADANKRRTTLFPAFIAFDPSGGLVTYGATGVDGNAGDAVLTYARGKLGYGAPRETAELCSPTISLCRGPTGLALDSQNNFYVNGTLQAAFGRYYGLFVRRPRESANPPRRRRGRFPWTTRHRVDAGSDDATSRSMRSGEIFIGNAISDGSGSSTSCQGRANVFAAGASGGMTDDQPLRVLTLRRRQHEELRSARRPDPRGRTSRRSRSTESTLFVADDFNNADRCVLVRSERNGKADRCGSPAPRRNSTRPSRSSLPHFPDLPRPAGYRRVGAGRLVNTLNHFIIKGTSHEKDLVRLAFAAVRALH